MCSEQGRTIEVTVVDHIEPHKLKDAIKSGNQSVILKAQVLFWDKNNWQPLCKQHHDSTKQGMEKSGAIIGCDVNVYPLDPNQNRTKPGPQISPILRSYAIFVIHFKN
ncbi:hypothetical protein HAP32_00552 [Serratia fonticola]|jgi:hypothetical protein|nr:hypothetical protein HAP32_00552 [Serratia fonticola]